MDKTDWYAYKYYTIIVDTNTGFLSPELYFRSRCFTFFQQIDYLLGYLVSSILAYLIIRSVTKNVLYHLPFIKIDVDDTTLAVSD